MKRIINLLLITCLLITTTSCSTKINAEELSKDYKSENVNVIELDNNFKYAMSNFSINLFKNTIQKDTNELVSPLSAIMCLAMIANGSDNNTRLQLENAFNIDVDSLNKYLYSYVSDIKNTKDCKVELANSIWFRNDGLNVKEEFLKTNGMYYNAQVYAAKFDNTTVNDINNWVKKYTDNTIEKIIDKIDSDSLMYLINALVFDSKWENEYEKKDIFDSIFTNYDYSTSNVSFLESKEYIYLEDNNYKGFKKNYINNQYSFVALLLNEDIDMYEFINELDGNKWIDILNNYINVNVNVEMPEFTYEKDMDLTDSLINMGIIDMFNSEADFSKITDIDIYCSKVKQKTYIKVDRNGTKATAITWGEMKETSIGPSEYSVILNRPFIYAIVDNNTNLPLFIGILNNIE